MSYQVTTEQRDPRHVNPSDEVWVVLQMWFIEDRTSAKNLYNSLHANVVQPSPIERRVVLRQNGVTLAQGASK